MPQWKVSSGPREYERNTHDRPKCWAYDITRDSVRRTLSVEVAGTVLSSDGPFPAEVTRALRTKGRSAVAAVLDRDNPPRRLLLHTHGIGEEDE